MAVSGIFYGLTSVLTSMIWGNPKSAAEVFKENLLAFSAGGITQNGCIENCVKFIESSLELADCDLSEKSKQMLESHLENFDRGVDEISGLRADDAAHLKTAFKHAFCTIAEDKWAAVVAGSFYPILSISDENEKIAAARQWIHRFFAGVDCFSQWRDLPFAHGTFVTKLDRKTSEAFQAHSHDVLQKKMTVMLARFEKDPQSFGVMLKRIDVKLAGNQDPSCLTALEKEYHDCGAFVAHCFTMSFPDIEKNIGLLKKCIWHGFTVRSMRQSILESDMSLILLREVFKDS
jgi:hypothetical protein